MGLLSFGTPLEWEETKKYSDSLRKKGIKQFLKIYKKFTNTDYRYPFKWGDEIEFSLIRFDHVNKRVQLLLKAEHLLDKLKEINLTDKLNIVFQPEYANYMIESTPKQPFTEDLNCFKYLEDNMELRRKTIEALLEKDEHLIALTNFPLLGCENFTYPSYKPTPDSGVTRSLFYPDQVIFNGHPRFSTLSANIRQRRNQKVAIYVPIYKDTNTNEPFIEDLNKPDHTKFIKQDHIYMDCTGFGMGCSCLQTTFQAENIEEARFLYDQLIPITPLMLALSASSPIWRGYLTDIDCRWNVISGSVDDRTEEELGLKCLNNDKYRIYKSRYDSVDSYLSEQGKNYNDIELVKNEELYFELIKNGVDKLLADHISHLFIRDPIVLFKEKLENNEEDDVDCFENIQSTNWQSMRFKPPPIKNNANSIGWRVEFRPIELQFTSFENSAFCAFVILLTLAIKQFNLNFLIPISKVDENMKRAQLRNACLEQKFYFRKNIYDYDNKNDNDNLVELSLDEILNGNVYFKGLISILNDYLNLIDNLEAYTLCKLRQYLKLLKLRSNGTLMTPASYIRKFVTSHPKYQYDSIVDPEINYDLMWNIYLIANHKLTCTELILEENC